MSYGHWVGASFNRYSIRLTTGSGKASRKNTETREKNTFTSDASLFKAPKVPRGHYRD